MKYELYNSQQQNNSQPDLRTAVLEEMQEFRNKNI